MEAIRHNVRKYQRHELHFGVSGTMFSSSVVKFQCEFKVKK